MEKRKTFSWCNFFERVYKEGNWKADWFEEKTKQKTEAGKVSITDFKSSPFFDIEIPGVKSQLVYKGGNPSASMIKLQMLLLVYFVAFSPGFSTKLLCKEIYEHYHQAPRWNKWKKLKIVEGKRINYKHQVSIEHFAI